jgi:hypothetical protein
MNNKSKGNVLLDEQEQQKLESNLPFEKIDSNQFLSKI